MRSSHTRITPNLLFLFSSARITNWGTLFVPDSRRLAARHPPHFGVPSHPVYWGGVLGLFRGIWPRNTGLLGSAVPEIFHPVTPQVPSGPFQKWPKLCLVDWLLTKNIRNRTGQRATPRRARAAPGIKSIGRSRKVPFEHPVQESPGYASHVYTVMSPLIPVCKLLT